MAIVVEEHRTGNSAGLVNLVLWVVILGIIGAAVYYFFFAKPEFVQVVGQGNFEVTRQVSGLKLDVGTLTQSQQFSALREHVTISETGRFGRANPFANLGNVTGTPAR